MHGRAGAMEIAARALVVDRERLLLVSNEGEEWYTPGGRLEPGETLPACVEREVAEETGLCVEATDLLHVAEYFELASGLHKVECYFLTALRDGELRADWVDLDRGTVRFSRFMTCEEIRRGDVYPAFLGDGAWLDGAATARYMGHERR